MDDAELTPAHAQVVLTNPTRDQLILALNVTALRPCVLCKTEPAGYAGVFIPDEPWRYIANAPRPGATRSIVYPICEPCIKANRAEEVELLLKRGHA